MKIKRILTNIKNYLKELDEKNMKRYMRTSLLNCFGFDEDIDPDERKRIIKECMRMIDEKEENIKKKEARK